MLPIVLFALLCLCIGIAPFGPSGLLVRDMWGQYVDYFSYLGSIVRGENNIIYTFSKALGGDMIGFTAYYLLSPFNLVFLLFDNAQFNLAVSLAIALKLGACGLTAAIFLKNTGKDTSWRLLIFSTAYALMSYNILYASNIMWLDGVMALPLVALGIHWLLEKKSPWLYTLSLAYALWTNYYIGYMLCIFSVLYFLMQLFVGMKAWDKTVWFSLLRFAGASLLAGALCAVVLVPTFLSLEGTKASFSTSFMTMMKNFRWRDFADRLFFGNIQYDDLESELPQVLNGLLPYEGSDLGLPSVFCGIVTLPGVFLFFANRGISLRERLLGGGMLLLMMLSLWVNALNLVWHGFNPPVCFPYRYAFIICFLSLSFAWRCFQRMEALDGGIWTAIAAVAVCLALLLAAAGGEEPMAAGVVAANGLALLLTGLGFVLLTKGRGKKAAVALLAGVQLLSLFGDGLAMGRLELPAVSSYRDYIRMTEPLIDHIKDSDEGFYRMEKTFNRSANDPLQFAYNGLTHFSSTNRLTAKELHMNLGYSADYVADYYGNGSTMSMDSFLGVKYLLSRERSCQRPYEPFAASEDVAAFRNPYALGLMFPVNEACLNAQPNGGSAFGRQNDILRAASGLEADVFTAVEGLELSGENVEILQTERFLRLDRVDSSADGIVSIRFPATDTNLLYASFQTSVLRKVSITCGDKNIGGGLEFGEIACLGSYAPGETVELELRLTDDSVTFNRWEIFSENEKILAQHMALLRENAGAVERRSSSRLVWEGTMMEGQEALILTVPYEDNWKAFVDGEETEPCVLLGGFLGVPVSAGEHRVELRYEPRGLTAGIVISAAALLCGALWLYLRRQKKPCEN